MKTRLTELLCIEYPLLQGGMAQNSNAELAAAVSNAGAAGTIGCGGQTPDWLREQILLAQHLTRFPFGINIPLPMLNAAEMIDICIELRPSFVCFSAGKPRPEHIERLHICGISVLCVVPNLRAALGAEKAGVDAVVIEGMESGGHVGEMTTMSLLTDVLPRLSVPVVAAGGLSDGRGLAAALLMGAEGAQVGTAFLLAEECPTHISAKRAICAAGGAQVHLYGKYGTAAGVSRGIGENKYLQFLELDKQSPTDRQLMDFFARVNYRTSVLGDVEKGMMYAGQAIEGLREIRPAAEIVKEYMQQAEDSLHRAEKLLHE